MLKLVFIGSFFELDNNLNALSKNSVFDFFNINGSGAHSIFLDDGRQCIDLILNEIVDVGKYFLPVFLCHSVLQAFKERGIECNFYSNNLLTDFKPRLPELKKNDVLFIIDYWGYEFIDNLVIQGLLDRGIIIIMDITQNTFSETRRKIIHDNYFVFSSLRKTFPIPDGAVLISSMLSNIEEESSSESVEEMLGIMKNKYEVLRCDLEIEVKAKELQVLYDIYARIEKEKDIAPVIPKKISDISIRILKSIHKEDIMKRREINLGILDKNLERFHFSPGFDPITPFFKMIKCESEDERDSIQKLLRENYIFAPVHWKFSEDVLEGDQMLSKYILSIPIDQRYDYAEMLSITSILNSVD